MADKPINPRRAKKSKLGCRTCKIRHVRCDETKPACRKCKDTGRKCDYLEASLPLEKAANKGQFLALTSSRRPISRSISPDYSRVRSPVVRPQDDTHTALCYDYFRTTCREEFQGYYSSRLWDSYFLQVAHVEPSIRHAILALSAMHYSRFACEHAPAKSFYRSYAITHFTNAVRELNTKLDQSLYSQKLALVASLVFTFYELLSGDEIVSLLHLVGGANIVATLQNKSPLFSDTPESRLLHASNSSTPSSVYSPGQHVDADFFEISDEFARAITEVSCYGVRYMFAPLAVPRLPAKFPSIYGVDGARRHLDLIIAYMYTTIDFRLEYSRTLPTKPLPPALASQIQVIEDLLRQWTSLFTTFQNPAGSMTDHERTPSKILEIQSRLANLKLATHFYEDESIYDSYSSDIDDIVSRCEQVLYSSSNPARGRFLADPAIVHPLYYITIKSRSNTIRRGALTLLRQAGREAAHDGRKLAAAAQWVIEREEADSKVVAEEAIGEVNLRARIRGLALKFDAGEEFVQILCSRKDEAGDWAYFGDVAWYDGQRKFPDQKLADGLAREMERYRAWHVTVL